MLNLAADPMRAPKARGGLDSMLPEATTLRRPIMTSQPKILDLARGAAPVRAVQLPWDFPPTPTMGIAPGSLAFELPLPHGVSATPETLLVAAFAISLHRYSGQATIPLDVTRAGKRYEIDLAVHDATCGDLLNRIGDALRVGCEASNHVRAAITWHEFAYDATDVDLHLVVTRPGRAVFLYNGNLFRRSTIRRWAGHLNVLVRTLESDLDAPIATLPLLETAELEWLDTIGGGPQRTLCSPLVHEAIEQRAVATPDAIALRHRDHELSYDRLNRRANQLARFLAAHDLGIEARVVVCVEPAFDIAIALLGILKAGATFVPLDPTYPAARIQSILEDTRPVLVISQAHLIARIPFGTLRVVTLDSPALEALENTNLDLVIDPSRIAYVYYTSGTTGAPKGVLASHVSMDMLVEAQPALPEHDRRGK